MSQIHLKGEDVGQPAISGSVAETAGGYTVAGGGTDIWGLSDQFYFSSLPQKGDFDLKVRVESLESADLYTKAGIMARESLEPGSAHAFFMVFPDNSPRNKNNGGYEFQFREVSQGDSAALYPEDYTTEPPEFPVNYPNTWLRLKRSQDQFEAFYSPDGAEWKVYASRKLKLSATLLVGLAVTSHNEQQASAAVFQDISFI